jgi:hypothetical protein
MPVIPGHSFNLNRFRNRQQTRRRLPNRGLHTGICDRRDENNHPTGESGPGVALPHPVIDPAHKKEEGEPAGDQSE